MDLHYSQTLSTLLKSVKSFTTLWIYTTLKHIYNALSYAWGFYYLMDLHYSQTNQQYGNIVRKFYYLMDLHYSQTYMFFKLLYSRFTTLWIYTTLKHWRYMCYEYPGFTTLWIYTTLKPQISKYVLCVQTANFRHSRK